MVCPACWGTTVAPKVLAKAKEELAELEAAHEGAKEAAKNLRGRARGMAGYKVSEIGGKRWALQKEIDRIETEIHMNKNAARLVGAAASD